MSLQVNEAEDCDSDIDSDSDLDLEQEVDEMMTDIFGRYDPPAEQSSPETDSDIDITSTDTIMDVEFDN